MPPRKRKTPTPDSDFEEPEAEASSEDTLVLGSSSSSEEEGSEEDSSEYEILPPPEFKVLPERSTRGKRLNQLMGEDEELDKSFWGHDTWEEEADDREWSTDDEGRYHDKFDSDFLESDSEDEKREEAEEEQRGRHFDKEARKAEKQRKKFDYENVAKQREQRKARSTRVWSVLRPDYNGPQLAKRQSGATLQQRLMAEAAKVEVRNTQIQQQLDDDNEMRKYRQQSVRQNEAKPTGQISTFVSWSSERKIEAEEMRKSEAQKRLESSRPPYERQLLFFSDASNPTKASLPPLYTQEPPTMPRPMPQCVVTGRRAKYIDPVTNYGYSDIESFRRIRLKTIQEQALKVSNMLQASITALEGS